MKIRSENGIGIHHHKLRKVKLTIGNNEAISVTAVWILSAHGPKLKQNNVYYIMTLLYWYHQLDGKLRHYHMTMCLKRHPHLEYS